MYSLYTVESNEQNSELGRPDSAMGRTSWNQTPSWILGHLGIRLRHGQDTLESDSAMDRTPWNQTSSCILGHLGVRLRGGF